MFEQNIEIQMNRKAISSAFNVSTIKDGVSSAIVEVSLATLLYDADANGASTSAQEFAVTYTLKVGNETILEQNVTSVTIQTPNGVSIKQNTKTNSGCTFVVEKDASPSGVIGITMVTTKNGNLYEPHTAITVAPNVRGENGERGKVGRFFYFGGTFDLRDTRPFLINDAQAPYFEHTETITTQSGTTTIKRYHVFNYETNGSYTMAQMWAISSDWRNKPWEAMSDDFKYLITEAIFSNFAHFGSSIISDDWMISQYGTIFDTQGEKHEIDSATATYDSYTYEDAYTLFDVNYPNSSKPSALNFAPYFAIDLKKGSTYFSRAKIDGTVGASNNYAKSLLGVGFTISSVLINKDILRIGYNTEERTSSIITLGNTDAEHGYMELVSKDTIGSTVSPSINIFTSQNSSTKVSIYKDGIAIRARSGSQIVKSKTWDELLS